MERLVLAPKCYAFIQASNANGPGQSAILNVSDYIVRGEVHRVQNAISTAQITLRNPKKIWTGGLDPTSKVNTFSPMDKITIFLERIPNTPIQVFTGFLDTTPLYQMYPGVVTLYASCTLKRLMYTYWDPALPFVYEFLAQFGWISDGNGNLTNYSAVAQGSDTILSYESQAAQDAANAQGHVTVTVPIEPNTGSSGSVQVQYGSNKSNLNKLTATKPFSNYQQGVSPDITLELTGLNLNTTYYYKALFTYTGGGSAIGTIQYYKTGGATSPPAFQINDSSLSNLLYAVLEDIAGWDDSSIFIEALPDDIVNKLIVLYQNLAENESVTLQQLNNFLGQILGTGSKGSGDGATTGNVPGQIPDGTDFTQGSWAIGFLNGLAKPVTSANVQAIMGWEAQEGGNWNNTAKYNPLNTTQTEPGSVSAGLQQPNIQAYSSWQSGFQAAITTITSNNNGYPAILAALEAGNDAIAVGQAIAASKWGTSAAVINTIQNTTPPILPNNVTSPLNPFGPSPGQNAIGTSTPTVKTKSATNKGGDASDPTSSSTSGYSFPLKTMPSQYNVVDSSYGGIDQGVIILTGKKGDPVYSMTSGKLSVGNDGPNFVYHGTNGNKYGPSYPIVEVSEGPWKGRAIFYGYVQTSNDLNVGQTVEAGKTVLGYLEYSGTTQNSGQALLDLGFLSGGSNTPPDPWAPGQSATADAETMLTNLQQMNDGDALTPSSPAAVTGLANSQNTPNTVADVQSLSVSAAFNTLFNFPSLENTETALLLTGDKSYMNDQSILPFIQQLTQGCLRSFQSMPNGNLFVFFPDYFGGWSSRKAYWSIDDIEILDGTIQVSDAALATHVFVSGDTIVADAGTVSPFDQVASTGVVSLTNAGISNFINRSSSVNDSKQKTVGVDAGSILGDDSQILSTPTDVLKFLQRYGVRPLVDNEPLIHSHYFELFMAYQLFQLMWARQYLSTFTFTFMPELYPGGIVYFPSHGLNMYIDEVIHTFDYTSGFTTQANLMAPSAHGDESIPFTNGLAVYGSGISSNPGGPGK